MNTPNYKPVVGSLLKILQDHRFNLVSWHGAEAHVKLEGTPRERRQQAKGLTCAEGSGVVITEHPTQKFSHVSIILDGEPDECVGHNVGPPALELAIRQFRKKWENKPIPTK